jgi:hypothetical protein
VRGTRVIAALLKGRGVRLARMHGTDEHVAVRDYQRAISFNRQLVLNAARR